MNCISKNKIHNSIIEKAMLYLGTEYKNKICFATWTDYNQAMSILDGDEDLLRDILIKSQDAEIQPEIIVKTSSKKRKRCCGQ